MVLHEKTAVMQLLPLIK